MVPTDFAPSGNSTMVNTSCLAMLSSSVLIAFSQWWLSGLFIACLYVRGGSLGNTAALALVRRRLSRIFQVSMEDDMFLAGRGEAGGVGEASW